MGDVAGHEGETIFEGRGGPVRHGREAAEMLIRLVRGEPVDEPRRMLQVALGERESTRR